jgi:hypothetical protein
MISKLFYADWQDCDPGHLRHWRVFPASTRLHEWFLVHGWRV